ncbi:hypothetical protein JOC27_000897 [Sporolactobacillus spathodeae]|uniref:Uncharacterized protein n=1 Tax=Sporolactobacillus spathodeae TaxID=1465502 RepID=A0ABS2Q6N0_9BACL|nr:hypothetical protein [Sporolactobacillus spathodeae]
MTLQQPPFFYGKVLIPAGNCLRDKKSVRQSPLLMKRVFIFAFLLFQVSTQFKQ